MPFIVGILFLVLVRLRDCAVFLNKEGEAVDVIDIIRQYALVCGSNQICDKAVLNFPHLPSFVSTHKPICPKCSCSDTCYSRNNCCPDKILLGPELECTNTTLVSITGSVTNTYPMVVDCPNIELRERCFARNDSNRNVYNTPVTSHNGITYRNMYCAACHNKSDITPWPMYIECMDEMDMSEFNYVTSMQETVALAYQNLCELQYLPNSHQQQCSDVQSDFIVDHCNTTGKWAKLDPDIEWACQNYPYAQDFRFFKNIFCFICNPTTVGGDVISVCDNSLGWLDTALNRACTESPKHYRTYPYKNIFCYYCNRPTFLFTDINTRFSFGLLNKEYISFAFQIESFRANPAYKAHSSKTQTLLKTDEAENLNVNLTNILYNYVLVQGAGLCKLDKSLPYIPPKACSCSMECIISENCCVDVALTTPNYCTSNQRLTDTRNRQNENNFLVINDCPYIAENNEIKTLCENDDNADIKSKIAVYSPNSKLSYKNVYCAICHEAEAVNVTLETSGHQKQFIPWEIHIRCYPFTDFTFFTRFKNVLRYAHDNNCIVKFVSSESIECLDEKTTKTGRCNTTGLLQFNDPDIEWACEMLDSPYIRNSDVFCEICNPTIDYVNDVIDTCNTTGDMYNIDPDAEYGCEHFPGHVSSSPYKNGFCKKCNMNSEMNSDISRFSQSNRGVYRTENVYDNVVIPARPSYRQMFVFSYSVTVEKTNILQTNSQHCSISKVYDMFKVSKTAYI